MCIYFYIISYCSCPHDVNLPHQTPAALRPCLPPSQEAGWVCRLTGGDDADGLTSRRPRLQSVGPKMAYETSRRFESCAV